MKIKPGKSRSMSICRGEISDRKFVFDEEEIPTVGEKPVKSLGSWCSVDLGDKEQVKQFRRDFYEGLGRTEKSGLPGKMKLW